MEDKTWDQEGWAVLSTNALQTKDGERMCIPYGVSSLESTSHTGDNEQVRPPCMVMVFGRYWLEEHGVH